MEENNLVKLLLCGDFKRIVLNSGDLSDESTIYIMQGLIDIKQPFRVMYDESHDNWYIRLTNNEPESEKDWKK